MSNICYEHFRTPIDGRSGGNGGSHTGAIVGGVIGGVAGLTAIAGLLFWFLYLKPGRMRSAENDFADRPRVDLAGEDDESGTPPSRSGPPMIEAGFFHPEPFVVPESVSGRPSLDTGTVGPGTAAGVASTVSGQTERQPGRRVSQYTLESSDPSSLITPTSRGRGGKSAHPPSAMRATNFVQHEDAGALDPEARSPGANQGELVELPPSYSAIRSKRGQRNGNTDPNTEGGGDADALPGPGE